MNRLRRFWQTITGQRARRWERACAIHESHRWDELERQAAAISRKDEAYVRMHRRLFGSRWIGPRPSAP